MGGTVNWQDTGTAEEIASVLGPIYYIAIVIAIIIVVFTVASLIANIISLTNGIHANNTALTTIAVVGILGCLFFPIAGIVCAYISLYVDREERKILPYIIAPIVASVFVCIVAFFLHGDFMNVLTEALGKSLVTIQRNSGPFIN